MGQKYDYLIVGAGIFGSVCAYELTKKGKTCLVIDKRDTIGGNCYTENVNGIHVHKYGAHIFHTNDKHIWDYINQFAEFKQYTHNVIANYKGEMYTLPFNMWTFNQLWGVKTEEEAKEILEQQRYKGEVKNLEDQARSMVGDDIYEKLINGYTVKQWDKPCAELPPSIIKRLPVRFTWDSNYFNDKYTGMPIGGYTQIFEKMLEGSDVWLNKDYFEDRDYYNNLADKVIYTGPIDKFFNYEFGRLEYNTLRFEHKVFTGDYQGNAVFNHVDLSTPYLRSIEHKHLQKNQQKHYDHKIETKESTVVSFDHPISFAENPEPYYPIRDETNSILYSKYFKLKKDLSNITFGGRLGEYKYLDLDASMSSAIQKAQKLI